MNIAKKIWVLLRPYHRGFYQIAIISAIFELIQLAGPFIFGKILDLLIKSNGLLTFQTASAIIIGLAGIRILVIIIDYINDIVIAHLLWKAEEYLSTTSFNKLLELSLDYHEKERTGTKINLVNKGKDKLMELLGYFTWEFQPIIIKLFLISIVMFITSWIFGAVFVVSLIPFLIITFKTYASTRKMRARRHDMYEVSSGEIGDALTNITVVKAFAQEKREQESFESIWEAVLQILTKEFGLHILTGVGRAFITEFFYIVLLIIGILEIRAGSITVGTLVFLISLMERSYSNVYRLGRVYERVVDAAEPVDRISALLGKKPTIKNALNPIIPDHIDGQVSFKHVTFGYQKRRVLKNVSFTIPAGSFTALVGRSGSGKSTIAKLLSRYYDPSSGAILIDNKYDLRELDLDTYRQNTSVVFQDSPVPDRKVWEVISYSAGKKTFAQVKDKVFEAAKLAHAHDFIMEFEENYQTKIGERGVKLSGGQKQRLAIARALFAEPKILIMDEPTSHLDTLSESMIQKALEDISKQRQFTKIIIAHRLSTVQRADQILVMERGRVVEHGNHSQLLKKNGIYAAIVRQNKLKE